jgi:hypothetical protein
LSDDASGADHDDTARDERVRDRECDGDDDVVSPGSASTSSSVQPLIPLTVRIGGSVPLRRQRRTVDRSMPKIWTIWAGR